MNITTITLKAATMALVASFVASSSLLAQRGGNYDPATETTLSGTVEEVLTIPGPGKGPGGMHLMLRTEAGVSEVHVGPVTFISAQGFVVAAGDAITVTGSKVTVQGKEAILAREITRGEQSLTLRDDRGVPLWSGSRR